MISTNVPDQYNKHIEAVRITGSLSGVTSTFCGLRSRWTMPAVVHARERLEQSRGNRRALGPSSRRFAWKRRTFDELQNDERAPGHTRPW